MKVLKYLSCAFNTKEEHLLKKNSSAMSTQAKLKRTKRDNKNKTVKQKWSLILPHTYTGLTFLQDNLSTTGYTSN